MKPKPIVIRPDIENPEMENDLKGLAKKKKWSLNKYIVQVLAAHIKKQKK